MNIQLSSVKIGQFGRWRLPPRAFRIAGVHKWGLSMAEEYSLRTEDSGWSIIDRATHEPARLDGIPLSAMEAEEAKHMLAILRGIDRVRTASKRAASFANKIRSKTSNAGASPQSNLDFGMLRPFKSD
jgi:hypothetical protein